MARVRTCELCRHGNPPSELFCEKCGASLADVPVTDGQGSAVTPSPPPSGETAMFREPQPPSARLVFAWGAVSVGSGLKIGLDATFSCLADQIAGYDAVSRRHAEIFVDGRRIFVRHLGSTNPTYVNGQPLSTGEISPLNHGMELLFSRSLRAVVELE